jgi:hypothetical protein
MNKTKAAWLQATKEAQDLLTGDVGPWTHTLDSEYTVLRDRATRLYYEWQAEKTGKSAQEVAYAVNESVHSRFD